MIICKHCNEGAIVKNGIVRGKQRYKCKGCGCNFVDGDGRTKPDAAVRRAFAVILYALGKGSYGFIAKLFGVTPAAVLKWVRQEAASLPDPEVSGAIREMEFDEMRHFIGSKKTNAGLSRRWIVLQGELSPGLQVVVMLQPSEGFTTR
jgi:transposase